MFKKIVCSGLLLIIPCSLTAQQSGMAMLYGTGSVYLNGSQLANSSATSNGDVIQTREGGAANLSAQGSSIAIQSNTIARFKSDGLALDRGSVSVATGKSFSVFARDYKITPADGQWTEYYITRGSGAIGIIARKNGIVVTCGVNAATLREGQQISRNDAADCGVPDKQGGAVPATKGPILSSRWAGYAAAGAGGALLGWALTRDSNPVSPALP